MRVDEIYNDLAEHMIRGMMLHDELANYYDFLSLEGYKRCHEYHYLAESCAYRGLCRYYINHHNKLIPHLDVGYDSIIPANWYDHVRADVDENTKRSAVKKAMILWVDWEKETKQLYEEKYKELLELGEVASACKVHELICDVDCELKKAERYLLRLNVLGYDMMWIMSEQKALHDKYDHKTKKDIKVVIC